ncbi:unnamed protein product [Tuber melanosporum]|uniref:(Perigord truffle) hypothetical protein n=1 Tax=Tuber melanosporum (strain Mel28) TaxID=656061 RepID=D5GEY7_TUBMM|nr:uncharacterized protein GSTUM_00006662001 [Tuber melanosporum]CAZ83080.1 unnamed protein product [Tuber melanosporum]
MSTSSSSNTGRVGTGGTGGSAPGSGNGAGGAGGGNGSGEGRGCGQGAHSIEGLKEVFFLLLSNPSPTISLLLLLFSGCIVIRLFGILISRKAVVSARAQTGRKKSRLYQATTVSASSSPGPPDAPEVASVAASTTASSVTATKGFRAGGDVVRSFSGAGATSASRVRHPTDPTPTPSYPFPRMETPRTLSSGSVSAAFDLNMSSGMGPQDKPIPSGTNTPASFAFQPPGAQPIASWENPDFPTPNMYELALLLHSEAGIDAFWSNIVKIATSCYKAERVTLAVPSDLTDLENTPWGQKATFNIAEDDCLSLTYMGDAGCVDDREESSPEEDDGTHDVPIPKEFGSPTQSENKAGWEGLGSKVEHDDDLAEPLHIDMNPDEPFTPVTIGLAESCHDSARESDWLSETSSLSPLEPPQPPPLPPELGRQRRRDMSPSGGADDEIRGRVFKTLQPLNYEADALLDGAGVSRVLQRGKVVVLGREYRDVKTHLEGLEKRRKEAREAEEAAAGKPSPPNVSGGPAKSSVSIPEAASTQGVEKLDLSSVNNGMPQIPSQPPTPLFFAARSESPDKAHSYEEYEQALTSPWSQSPAPSPAPKQDPHENPFFALPKVDEESFDPQVSSPVYSTQERVNAIGFESAWTVIHIPLVHPSQSKHDPASHKKAPIAILSILSPVIPYPRNLIHSLSHFAPLAATAFSLAQSHANVVNQLTHLRYGRPFERKMDVESILTNSFHYPTPPDNFGGASVTSPSEISSSLSKDSSSRVASPGWEGVTLGMTGPHGSGSGSRSWNNSAASTPASPGMERQDEYFGPPPRGGKIFSRQNSGNVPTLSTLRARIPMVELKVRIEDEGTTGSSGTAKGKRRESSHAAQRRRADMGMGSSKFPNHTDLRRGTNPNKTPTQHLGAIAAEGASPPVSPGPEIAHQHRRGRGVPRRKRPGLSPGYPHTLLHSYGADYAATFQSLYATTSLPGAPSGRHGISSKLATSIQPLNEMPPPSNRLLRTIIDSIPVHVFTALPHNGETTWVNARMLDYRGSTVEELIKGPWDALHPDDRGDYVKRWGTAIRKGEAFSHQVRIRRFDGIYRWFMIRAVPLRDSRGIIVHWFGTNMDIHDQRLAEVDAARQSEMAESESKYRSLANSSPQIVFAATSNDGITYANTQWQGYSGQTLPQALQLGFMEHVHPADRHKCALPGPGETLVNGLPCLGNSFKMTAGGGNLGASGSGKFEEEKPTFSTELRLKDKHGNYRWHLVRCVGVETNFGTGDGQWFGTCTDINNHKLLEQRLKEAKDAAQKTMESKTRFLANMSHEIRTPLIGISGMVNFLLDTPLNGEQLDYCHTISQSSDGLLSVINDILDLSKVEAGMMRMNPEWFRINTLIEDANELLSAMAVAKDLELSFIVEDDVPPVVCGDRVRLRQVMLNVIGNAIKFTTKGEVFSRWSVIKDAQVGEGEVMLQFECHDTGPGFDRKDEELMFKPFSQIDGSSTREHGGSGLGLVISRQLVELHGGRMTAKSQKGKGSTFICSSKFRLPRNPTDSSTTPQAAVTPSAITESPGQKRGILESARLNDYRSDTPPGPAFSEGHSLGTLFSASHEPGSAASIRPTGSAVGQVHGLPIRSPPDPAAMRLSLPSGVQQKYMAYTPPQPGQHNSANYHGPPIGSELGRAVSPPMFSILIVSEQHYSRVAIAHHIRVTLPKGIPNQITDVSKFSESKDLIGGEDPVVFTHVVINLPEHLEIIELLTMLLNSSIHSQTTTLVLTNPTQRATIMQGAADVCDRMSLRLQFIYKPIKPSRFGVIFDPANERDASTDRNRDSAQQVVESQKRVFSQMEKEVGNKGYRVLLVEDNRVNQKVLLRFLARVGLEVETASDGEECVERVFEHEPGHYGLILCDLHMPRKDGFQATKEIRLWEQEHKAHRVPIVALSANVMSDVADRCIAAGFSRYVSKPVDFKELSSTIKDLLQDSQEGEFDHIE